MLNGIYPSATHNRFNHTLGAMHLLEKYSITYSGRKIKNTKNYKKLVLLPYYYMILVTGHYLMLQNQYLTTNMKNYQLKS